MTEKIIDCCYCGKITVSEDFECTYCDECVFCPESSYDDIKAKEIKNEVQSNICKNT